VNYCRYAIQLSRSVFSAQTSIPVLCTEYDIMNRQNEKTQGECMSDLVLKASPRETHYSRGELNKFRDQGSVPGCIYGKGIDSIPVFVDYLPFLKTYHDGGRIFSLDLNGKKHLISVESVEKDAIGKRIMHVAFHKLSAKTKIKIDVPITLVGNAIGVKHSGFVHIIESEIPVEGKPNDIPESIEVDVTELDVNGNIHWSDIKLPAGLTANWGDDNRVCVVCKHAKVEVEETPDIEVGGEVTTEVAAEATHAGDEEVKKAS
jgi:large subunit ribosomal protein L25